MSKPMFHTRLRCDKCGRFISYKEEVVTKNFYGFLCIDRTEVYHKKCSDLTNTK